MDEVFVVEIEGENGYEVWISESLLDLEETTGLSQSILEDGMLDERDYEDIYEQIERVASQVRPGIPIKLPDDLANAIY